MRHAIWQVVQVLHSAIRPFNLNGPANNCFFIILFGCFSFYSHIILSVYFWYSSGLSIRSISIAITQIKYFLDFFSSFFSVAFFILSLSSYIILQALSSLTLGAWSFFLFFFFNFRLNRALAGPVFHITVLYISLIVPYTLLRSGI